MESISISMDSKRSIVNGTGNVKIFKNGEKIFQKNLYYLLFTVLLILSTDTLIMFIM